MSLEKSNETTLLKFIHVQLKLFSIKFLLYAIWIQMFTIEAIFNQMYSIGPVLIHLYAMDDRFGSARCTFSAPRPRQVVCQDGRLRRADGITLYCYM